MEGVAEQAWTFMNAVPGVGALIAQGIHCRAEAEFSTAAGMALMQRGLSADQAMVSVVLVFTLVSTAFIDGQRMDVPPPGETEAERDHVVSRLAPGVAVSAAEQELHKATVRAMREPTKRVLDRRIGIVLGGVESRYGLGSRQLAVATLAPLLARWVRSGNAPEHDLRTWEKARVTSARRAAALAAMNTVLERPAPGARNALRAQALRLMLGPAGGRAFAHAHAMGLHVANSV